MSSYSRMIGGLIDLLDRASIRYVFLCGYEAYPDSTESDVDFMVSAEDFRRLPELLRTTSLGDAVLVQQIWHETSGCYFVFAAAKEGEVVFIHPDATADYCRRGILYMRCGDILEGRRRHKRGFWIPAPEKEFEYYLIKRSDKGSLSEVQAKALMRLFKEAPRACERVIHDRFRLNKASLLVSAFRAENVGEIERLVYLMHGTAAPADETLFRKISRKGRNVGRILNRCFQPTGLIVAVLGPDGSGKTTVIESIQKTLLPAFRQTHYYHLRPKLRGQADGRVNSNPHQLPPRSYLLSAAKLGYFVLCYWLGWIQVKKRKISSSLVIFDRYFHDVFIDPVRYRLPFGKGRWTVLGRVVPQPDVWIFLTAPDEVVTSRKGEVPPETLKTLREQYQNLAHWLGPTAHIVDTSQELSVTLNQVHQAILGTLHARAMKRSER